MLEVDFRTTSVRSKCPESLMVLDVTGSMVEWVRGVGDDAAGVTRMVWGMAFFNKGEERLHTANRCFVYQIDLGVPCVFGRLQGHFAYQDIFSNWNGT